MIGPESATFMCHILPQVTPVSEFDLLKSTALARRLECKQICNLYGDVCADVSADWAQAQHQSTGVQLHLSERTLECKRLQAEADRSAAALAAALQRESSLSAERDGAVTASHAQQRQHAEVVGQLQKDLEISQVRIYNLRSTRGCCRILLAVPSRCLPVSFLGGKIDGSSPGICQYSKCLLNIIPH